MGGDTKAIMARIQAIEAFLDNKSTSDKPINLRNEDRIRKSCTACKFKGHLVSECWGKCKLCGKYGHKSHLCRNKPPQELDGGKIKQKIKKKKGGKEKAKRVAEL